MHRSRMMGPVGLRMLSGWNCSPIAAPSVVLVVAAMTTGPVVACEMPRGVMLVGISVVRQPREW